MYAFLIQDITNIDNIYYPFIVYIKINAIKRCNYRVISSVLAIVIPILFLIAVSTA